MIGHVHTDKSNYLLPTTVMNMHSVGDIYSCIINFLLNLHLTYLSSIIILRYLLIKILKGE